MPQLGQKFPCDQHAQRGQNLKALPHKDRFRTISVCLPVFASVSWASVMLPFIPFLSYAVGSRVAGGRAVIGRTMPWRVIVEQKIAELCRFKQFLRLEDRAVFDDLLAQCRLYAAGGEVFASPVKEMSLLFWMIFAQHKRLMELEKRFNETLK